MEKPTLERKRYTIRPWRQDDMQSLVAHANNPRVARNLRDGFPHPYRKKDAREWLRMVEENKKDLILAIEVDGEAAGGIGLHPLTDVYRYNTEIGYWLSESYWGMGLMSDAVGVMTEYAFTRTKCLRLFATIFDHNRSSMRVLEKNGFRKEAVHRKTVVKEGKVMDEHLFALLREEWMARRG